MSAPLSPLPPLGDPEAYHAPEVSPTGKPRGLVWPFERGELEALVEEASAWLKVPIPDRVEMLQDEDLARIFFQGIRQVVAEEFARAVLPRSGSSATESERER